jgi:hypothetical protein
MKSEATTLDSIECPNCGHAIPVSEVLSHQIAERARAESGAEIAKLKSSLARKEQDTALNMIGRSQTDAEAHST